MPFEKITAGKLSQAVTHQIEELILRGILRPGERLPSERDLAERMGVSRPSLREAIADLQEKGLLSSRAGAGIFVANVLGNAFSPALVSLFSEHDAAVFDYVAFRRDMEGLAAERAASPSPKPGRMAIPGAFFRINRLFAIPQAPWIRSSGAALI